MVKVNLFTAVTGGRKAQRTEPLLMSSFVSDIIGRQIGSRGLRVDLSDHLAAAMLWIGLSMTLLIIQFMPGWLVQITI